MSLRLPLLRAPLRAAASTAGQVALVTTAQARACWRAYVHQCRPAGPHRDAGAAAWHSARARRCDQPAPALDSQERAGVAHGLLVWESTGPAGAMLCAIMIRGRPPNCEIAFKRKPCRQWHPARHTTCPRGPAAVRGAFATGRGIGGTPLRSSLLPSVSRAPTSKTLAASDSDFTPCYRRIDRSRFRTVKVSWHARACSCFNMLL